MASKLSDEELAAYHGIFSIFDKDGSNEIDASELGKVLEKLGRDPAGAAEMLRGVDKGPGGDGKVSFDEFVGMMEATSDAKEDAEDGVPSDAPDPKVLEFLRILEEYRVKCEEEGNYLEAGRATEQLHALRKKEERRQAKALRARQISERQDVQIAHNMQYAEFNASWDKYMAEYDQMAQMYIAQMKGKHEEALREFQEALREEVGKKAPKFSRELLDWRRRQTILAKQRKYAEAEKIKRIADEMEAREKAKMDEGRLALFQQREAKFRQQQQSELTALLKRIDGRRKEHLKQRALDSKRLLQRNRNVQCVLESKQGVELNRRKLELKAELTVRGGADGAILSAKAGSDSGPGSPDAKAATGFSGTGGDGGGYEETFDEDDGGKTGEVPA